MSFLNSIAGEDQIRNIREWKWIIVLSFLCLLCGYHDYLDIVLVCLMEVIILTCNITQLFYSFILLYFFEEVICLDNLYGLSLLVLTPIIGLRLLLYMFRHKILPSGKDFGLMAFILGSGVVALLTGHFAKATLVVMMNMIIVVLFGSVMRRAKDRKKIIEGIFMTIAAASTASVVYGFIHNNYMIEVRPEKTIMRFNGAYEPNYTALFSNMGILSAFYLRKKMGTVWAGFIIVFNLLSIILTRSTTGLAALVIIMFMLTVLHFREIKQFLNRIVRASDRKNRIINSIIIGAMALEVLALVVIVELHTHLISEKLMMVINRASSGNIEGATSGRIPIAKAFLKSLNSKSLPGRLFGNGPQSMKVYTEYFGDYKYAHNTYIDILYSFGYLGGCSIFIFLLYRYIKNRFLGYTIRSRMEKELLGLTRLVLLISGLMLSLHCETIFLVLFLI